MDRCESVDDSLLSGSRGSILISGFGLPQDDHGVFQFLAAEGNIGADFCEVDLDFSAKLFHVATQALILNLLLGLTGLDGVQMGKNHVREERIDFSNRFGHGAIL
jgi:hypothetical protein